MNSIANTLFTVLLAGFAMTASAGDIANGKKLHDAHCMRCHDSGVYTRKDRQVNSLEALQKQVARCELTQSLKWFDSDRDDVVSYLNENFYKF